jgi:hypothetical protein
MWLWLHVFINLAVGWGYWADLHCAGLSPGGKSSWLVVSCSLCHGQKVLTRAETREVWGLLVGGVEDSGLLTRNAVVTGLVFADVAKEPNVFIFKDRGVKNSCCPLSARSSETSVRTYQSIRRHSSEVSNFHSDHCENLRCKSVSVFVCCAPKIRLKFLGFYHNSMEQIPSWEANRSSANQEIPRVLWNPNVHYRAHKSPPPVPILSVMEYEFWP